MKAFVTGATGFVGSHLVDRILSEGFEVTCLKRKSSNTRWLDGKNVSFVEGDLFSNNVLENALKDVDYIFHVAGDVKTKNEESYENSNSVATKNLIEIAYKVNPGLKKFVFISSQAVCGPTPGDEPITEEYIPKPITAYGRTKRKAEKEVLKFRDKFPVVIIRPPAVYGPRATEILVYFKTYKKGLNSIIGFDDKYLSIVHVDDLVEGIFLAATKESRSGDIFFICSDQAYNWDEIGDAASLALNKKAVKLRIPHFVVYTVGFLSEIFSVFSKNAPTLNLEKCKDITRKRWVCSNHKAKEVLGFRESFTLKDGFKQTADWYAEEGWI